MVRLSDLGVAAASIACDKAREHGATPADVLAIADHYARKPGAWGPGALQQRVAGHVPGIQLAAGWPPVAAGYMSPEEQEAQADRQRQAAQRQDDEAKAARERDEQLALKQQRGRERWDSLTANERDEFVQSLLAFHQDRFRKQGPETIGFFEKVAAMEVQTNV